MSSQSHLDPRPTIRSEAIGITLGDPSGIGPEIVASAISSAGSLRDRLVVFGDRSLLERGASTLGCDVGGVRLIDCGVLEAGDVVCGEASTRAGAASIAYLEAAIAAALVGDVGALVTAPIHKGSARAAGLGFIGHTELLADRFGAERVAMMFVGPRLKVVLATIHIPLSAVSAALTPAALQNAIELGVEALRSDFGAVRPRVGVLGLNPHASEGGLLGDEERDVIAPVIEACRARFADAGIELELEGPLVPDAAFRRSCDLFVAMYHDQALIPIKLLDFDDTVNVTLGLPIVRTSPDHGTAHDIAGRGIARPDSMIAAVRLAASMLAARC